MFLLLVSARAANYQNTESQILELINRCPYPLVRRCKNHQSLAYQVSIANTDIYKCSAPAPAPPQSIRDWNALPDSLISSAEGAEVRVAKFISLVGARD